MRAGCQATLLVRAAVHDKFEVIFADAIEIQKRAAFGRGTVGGHAFAFFFKLTEEIEQGLFDVEDLVGKAFVVAE